MKTINWIVSLLVCILTLSCGKPRTDNEAKKESLYDEAAILEDDYALEEISSEDVKQDLHMAVDLGLPSGVKWATTNVGASSPSDFGEYYALGEIYPSSDYTPRGNPNIRNISKNYTNETIEGNPMYDASTAHWGSQWRLPSNQEWRELQSNCEWKWTNIKGVNGYKITGPNGNSIFLPAGGYKNGGIHGTESVSENTELFYWIAPGHEISGYRRKDNDMFTAFYRDSGSYVEHKRTVYYDGLPIRPITYASYEELGIKDGKEEKIDDEVKPTISGTIAGHEYVDLGLPSGTRWATMNLGAKDYYDNGTLYQWGAPKPGEYYASSDESTLGNDRLVENISGHQHYDAALREWGESWRMPSADELSELVNLCDWTVLQHDNSSYYLATGPNKNCLIIPLGGSGIWGSVPQSRNTSYYMRTYGQTLNNNNQPSPIVTYDKQNILRNLRPVSD